MNRSSRKTGPEANASEPVDRHVLEVRVRYCECDPMNYVHHSVYPVWMEMGRTEMLRQQGMAYRDLEAQGVFFVIGKMNLRYRRPATYDDLLQVETLMMPSAGVKIEHAYRITRDGELLTEADTTMVCVNREGRPQPIPEALRL